MGNLLFGFGVILWKFALPQLPHLLPLALGIALCWRFLLPAEKGE